VNNPENIRSNKSPENAINALSDENAEDTRSDDLTFTTEFHESETPVDDAEMQVPSLSLGDKINRLQTEILRLEEHNRELMQENSQLENAIFQANDMALKAETASHSKSQFLADMSHEIRTPMNAILGMAQVIETTTLSDEQRDFITTIRTSGETLIELINDILDFSKIEAGRLDFECIKMKPGAVVAETISLLKLKAEGKGLYIKSNIANDVPDAVAGDPMRLRQILINLVGNAVKFTHEGGITISIKLVSVEEIKYCLEFSVADTGIGIPQDRIDRLFHPFSQVDASTSRKYGGTGLGLAISSRLCEMMNGKMWVESTVGKGSTFLFRAEFLPPPSEDVQEVGKIVHEEEIKIDPSRIRLLLAEDNEVNSKVAMIMLRRAGYNPTLVEDGQKVLDAFARADFDVVLMDMQMPVLDGVEATRKLRRSLAHRHSKCNPYIIALTASVGKPDRDRCIEAGMDAFLPKPVRINELMTVLKNAHRERTHHGCKSGG
jgi:signal transduction histidine kinase/ActR/RegA family two-component response regulator